MFRKKITKIEFGSCVMFPIIINKIHQGKLITGVFRIFTRTLYNKCNLVMNKLDNCVLFIVMLRQQGLCFAYLFPVSYVKIEPTLINVTP